MSKTRDHINGLLDILTTGGGGGGGGIPDASADNLVYARRNNSWTRAIGFTDDVITPMKNILLDSATTGVDVDDFLLSIGGRMGMQLLLDTPLHRAVIFASATGMKSIASSASALLMVRAHGLAIKEFVASTALSARNLPVMTSNTAPSGVASASSIYSATYNAYQAFDAASSYWCSAAGTPTNQWVKYDFGAGNSIFAHTIILTLSGDGQAKSLRVECSDNNIDWVVSETLSFASNSSAQPITLYCPAAGKYRYWRVFIFDSYYTYCGMDSIKINGFIW